ncbi:ATP-binding protein [Massilia agilis]|uniref:histidine kinase n=1 Tax=Massilia agilis TaxID=1811226 RepID=A0ABT2DFP0_9BURK|nr:ATP-binding protein [Massilia agilis]MCS0809659.1 ATP-binding protein [Massilia agilis]
MGRLFWKFFFATWLVQALAVLAISTGIWFKDRNAAHRSARVDFGPPGVFAVDAAAQTLRFGGLPALRALLTQHDGMQLYAVDAGGHELLGRPTDAALLQELRQLHARDPAAHALQTVKAEGNDWLLFAARSEQRGARKRGYGLGGHRAPRDGYFPLMPMLLAMLGSLVSAALLAWHFAKPIRKLRAAFDAVAAGKLDTRIGAPAKRGDELTDLSRDFDRMAQRLEDEHAAQRRLLHDVSHEMRSPLARLQAAIGLARQRPDRVGTWLDRIERESTRMDAMIGEVLALARLDAGVGGALADEVVIEELVAQVVDDARFEAQASGKSVSLSATGASVVRGGAEMLHSAIENVVRNAVKHTEDGTAVTASVTLDARAGQVRIAVCDHGPGVPDAELELIFRPFQRGSQNTGLPGHGLGLAIAQRVVRSHGGQIRARNRDGGGLCVEIVLPLAPGSGAPR